jgi:acyl-coenzyme A synthetase/AMP-(fatty) acid ligase
LLFSHYQVVAFSHNDVGQEQEEEVDQEVELGDPAMIIYTSGTTGPPKVNKRVEV